MSDEMIGKRVGDYEVLGVLGAGGMGKVYKVRNVLSDRVEAMKVLLPNLSGQKELGDRFLQEIKVLASLNNPNIAALRTALTVDNQLVMIMEYVEGTTLAARLQSGPLPVTDALNFTDQVLSALSYAHQQQIIHRDIKPANMMLTPQGVVKLMDFGIARSGTDRGLTMTGTTLGSLAYMSPEQVKCEPIDARSDIYAVGVSLYEMVTDKKPFEADSNFAIMQAHLEQAPRPPIELNAGLPPALSEIILMAMSKEPAQRFQSADAFRAALKSVAPNVGTSARTAPVVPARSATPTPTVPMTPAGAPMAAPPPHAAPSGHRGVYITLGALIVFVALVAAGFSVPRWLKTRASQEKDAAPPTLATPAPAANASATANDAAATAAAATAAATAAADAAKHAAAAAAKQSQAPTPPVDVAPAGPPPPDPAVLAQLDHEMDQMSARAAAVSSSLDGLQHSQAGQGMQLRGDMVQARQMMDTYMGKAQASLQTQDIEGTKKYLDLAETQVAKLEKFLGR